MNLSRLLCLGLLTTGPLLSIACSEDVDPFYNEELGEHRQSLPKPLGVNGADDFCDDAANRCGIGEGDCDKHTQCFAPGFTMRCGVDNGAKWGFKSNLDICIPNTCQNGILDPGETTVDCGGNCGSLGPCAPAAMCTGPLGGDDYCTTCPCAVGEGDCDTNSECASGLICGNDNGGKFGLSSATDVCVPSHCQNGVQDGDETAVDCGGSCGTQGVCSAMPVCTGSNGDENFCTTCLCQVGQGDCDTNSECGPGLVCINNNGGKFGLGTSTDVCAPSHCGNGVQDGDETAVDCGGSCGTQGVCDPAAVCTGSPGDENYCTTCACQIGEGDCDSNAECATGLVCANDIGPRFGFPAGSDVCVPAHCTNGVLDGDETELNCGGSCGPCSSASYVAAGSAHACLVSNGNVFCWGDNTSGQVGPGGVATQLAPVAVPGLSAVTRAAAGRSHSCAIGAGGVISCWGRGVEGQLGNGASTSSASPVSVSSVTGATELALGDNFSCALAGSSVYCWGDNTSGQTGNGSVGGTQASPALVLTGAVAIAAGGRHACAVQATGTVACWGEGTNYQLGNNSSSARGTPVAVTGVTNATDVTAGDAHSCALSGGSVYCWGLNAGSMLGTGEATATVRVPAVVSGITNAIRLAAGWRHTCAVRTGGAVSCWGRGDYGQLGAGNTLNQSSPVAALNVSNATLIDAGEAFTCARTPTSVRCWGYNDKGQLGRASNPLVLAPTGISLSPVMVSALDANTCAVGAGGAVTCWGANDGKQIGDGTDRQRRAPTTISGLSSTFVVTGGGHNCAITAGGGVSCWGSNLYGQLGDGSTTAHATPAAVSGVSGAVELTAGVHHTCARTGAGAVLCWGRNQYGEVGDGTNTDRSTPVTVIASGATALIAGQRHNCAVVSGGISCWGRNQHGQLGDGTLVDKNVPTAVSGAPADPVELAAGQRHTCARTSAGAISCWGSNANGQLGDGTTADHITPAPVTGIGSVSDISAGGSSTCALVTATSKIMCWGWNAFGQLGDATQTDRLSPKLIPGAGNYTAVFMGTSHACARLSPSGLRCWGSNDYGQIGNRNAVRYPEGEPVAF